MPWTHRFLREFLRPRAGAVDVREGSYVRDGRTLPARSYRPAGASSALPAWVVLHGLTRTGREHIGLNRFARAFAAAGNLVLVPDIPEWRALRVAPAATGQTIRAAVHALEQRPDVRAGRVGLLAFSFGATQAVLAGADPELAPLLHGIVGWGGYADLHAAIRFGLTGVHEFDGVRVRMEPDPYGTWIIAGNYLTAIPGYEEYGDVERALYALACEAGERGLYAWDPVYDASKARLGDALPRAHRELFDYLAPPTHRPRRDEPRAHALAEQLAHAALRVDPGLDPRGRLGAVQTTVLLAHGRDDRLIPFSETVRLSRLLPAERLEACVITGLYAHSGGTLNGLGVRQRALEAARFLLLMRRIVGLV